LRTNTEEKVEVEEEEEEEEEEKEEKEEEESKYLSRRVELASLYNTVTRLGGVEVYLASHAKLVGRERSTGLRVRVVVHNASGPLQQLGGRLFSSLSLVLAVIII
jgi:hypothetical protein